jgi:cytochrome c oxidase assembly factor CtaG
MTRRPARPGAIAMAAAAAWTMAASPALAHAGHAPAAPGWFEDGWATGLVAVAGVLYAAGLARLWRRAGVGRGVAVWRAGCFAAGWAALAAALASPLAGWSDRAFALHMIEHEILMTIAAPLLVLTRPLLGMLWAFPPASRRALGGLATAGPLAAAWAFLTDPLAATVLHGAALWLWHMPALFTMALESPVWHALQHASFFGTAVLFWWSLAKGRQGRPDYGPAVFWLFATSLHTGFLGVLLTLAPSPWYPAQEGSANPFGLSPLEDQQIAGLVMWAPAGLVYAGAALLALGLWVGASGGRATTAASPIGQGGRHVPLAR